VGLSSCAQAVTGVTSALAMMSVRALVSTRAVVRFLIMSFIRGFHSVALAPLASADCAGPWCRSLARSQCAAAQHDKLLEMILRLFTPFRVLLN